MKQIKLFTTAFALFLTFAAVAQDKKSSFTFAMNQDNFFGFYPSVTGTIGLNEKADFTFYSIFWTTPSFGTGGGGGLWTEFGAGLNLNTMDGKLKLNPQVGFLNGKLLSNGAFPMLFEGVVPSLTANLGTDKMEGQIYAGYYAAIREGQVTRGDALVAAASQNNFLHWWGNLGYKFSSKISVGGHYEHLRSNPSVGDAANLYLWAGPYIQFTLPKGLTLRFTGGANVMDRARNDANNSFYKLSAAFTL